MEKLGSAELKVILEAFDRSDVGSGDLVVDHRKTTQQTLKVDCEDIHVVGNSGKNIFMLGGLVVINTADALLIVRRGKAKIVKDVVVDLMKQKTQ